MATTKASKKSATAKKAGADHGEPRFPYTTEPQALGRLLTEIPKRPRPPKITLETLKGWSVSNNNNARTAITVMKKLGLIGASGEPTDSYTEFMKTGTGPAVLAERIKETYRVLFENSHAPQTEPNDELKKLFNIHSGGGPEAMRLQVQTFKTLADHADFTNGALADNPPQNKSQSVVGAANSRSQQSLPPVQIDLHIHLPENKSSREYETIIQDIARYIYGRDIDTT